MTTLKNPMVAISSEFMNAFAAVSKKMQSKVLEFKISLGMPVGKQSRFRMCWLIQITVMSSIC